MDLLQEYKELYYRELEFKASLNGKMDAAITFLTILCTGHMFMWNIICDLSLVIQPFPIIFILVEAMSVWYTINALYFFYRAYFHYKYEYVSPKTLSQEIRKNLSLSKYYSRIDIDKANYEKLANTYIKYAIMMREENLRKNNCQMNFSNSIVKGIILLMVSYFIWLFVINRVIY